MKKLKKLSLIGLASSALFLTGCGSDLTIIKDNVSEAAAEQDTSRVIIEVNSDLINEFKEVRREIDHASKLVSANPFLINAKVPSLDKLTELLKHGDNAEVLDAYKVYLANISTSRVTAQKTYDSVVKDVDVRIDEENKKYELKVLTVNQKIKPYNETKLLLANIQKEIRSASSIDAKNALKLQKKALYERKTEQAKAFRAEMKFPVNNINFHLKMKKKGHDKVLRTIKSSKYTFESNFEKEAKTLYPTYNQDIQSYENAISEYLLNYVDDKIDAELISGVDYSTIELDYDESYPFTLIVDQTADASQVILLETARIVKSINKKGLDSEISLNKLRGVSSVRTIKKSSNKDLNNYKAIAYKALISR
ncbi:hypothetical protein L2737_16215 [Shewanella electrodiphila]|uniref:Lipoprotein n=1 Tax=Shewanella electrodiphila TaxID=934143 RepID=A0ABT0KT66_9GAMM|nr:hypothetical protein [Shewanella electrodiphila]MCL1046854.1 hypothetical protein [Shewanella electrodiphila]